MVYVTETARYIDFSNDGPGMEHLSGWVTVLVVKGIPEDVREDFLEGVESHPSFIDAYFDGERIRIEITDDEDWVGVAKQDVHKIICALLPDVRVQNKVVPSASFVEDYEDWDLD